jgi:hypothetical protein
LELSGVVMPMEVGEPRNWAWYAFAAAMLALLVPLLAVALLVPPLPLLLVLPLLLHAATSSAEVTATTAAKVFLIHASFLAGARGNRAVESQLNKVLLKLLSCFST